MKIPFFTHLIERHNKNTTSILVSGFTLIELMVATTIFSIVMLMGVGSLIVSSNSAKAAQRLRIAMDNVNFAMESMTRELRVGTYYECAGTVHMTTNSVADCPLGGGVIAFTPQRVTGAPDRVGYYKQARSIGTSNTLVRCADNSLPSSCPSIVAHNVDVQDLKFYVKGSASNDTIQPSVRIIMKGAVTIGGVTTPFILQSIASQRSTEN